LASVVAQAVVYWALIRLLVVDTGALDWAAMGIRRFDGQALAELAGGALWAIPVIVLTIPVALALSWLFPVEPVSPLPPAGEPLGFALNLVAGAIVAPIGEELLFRGFATTAWARDLGRNRALVQGALFFALVHVLTIGGATAGEALGLAVIGFATRVPVALVLGWLFLKRGSIWTPIGLHAAFNGILLVLGEAALRSGAV
jgi:membrane protease YdiL (CAAX protease family)